MAIDNSFCTHCGAVIPEGSRFCAECGTAVDGTDNPYIRDSGSSNSGGLDNVRVFILLYGVLTSIFGVLIILMCMAITPELWEQALEMSGMTFDLDYDTLIRTACIEGGVILASGICALLSSYFIKNQKSYPAALAFCIIASLLSLVLFPLGIATLAVGIYMSYRIYASRNLFRRVPALGRPSKSLIFLFCC